MVTCTRNGKITLKNRSQILRWLSIACGLILVLTSVGVLVPATAMAGNPSSFQLVHDDRFVGSLNVQNVSGDWTNYKLQATVRGLKGLDPAIRSKISIFGSIAGVANTTDPMSCPSSFDSKSVGI